MSTILDKVKQEILKSPDVTSEPHRFGDVEFCITSGRSGSRAIEMGHIHGNHLADLPFPMQIRNELINSGRVSPDHIIMNMPPCNRNRLSYCSLSNLLFLY
jgi:hypothetical protein